MSAALRAPTEEDVPAVVRLMSDNWPEPTDAEAVKRAWTAPGVQVERDARVEEHCYASIETIAEGKVWVDLRGRPSPAMLDWAEHRARESATQVFAGGWSSNDDLLRELERRGFRFVRHSLWMYVDLTEPTASPVWPEGIEAQTFRPGDERAFHRIQQETFEDSWEPATVSFEAWRHAYVGTPRFVPELWFLALAEGEPAGFAICHPHPGNAQLGWVGELGVRRPWRRRGLGRALLLHAFSAFRGRGLPRAGLSVDSQSPTGAHRLYEQAGMREHARYDIYEKATS
jgi:ribosomal protein S18 acetylase RimI-like enzyme